ncbi:MAG: hypothetical protein NTX80_01375 [Candidatus Saccharibacteria bacterium]|nr:hypothetical protein [Candidatus Saccharibacteria bacterium]
MSMSSNDQLNIKPLDYQDENPILKPPLDTELKYGPYHTRDTLKALGNGVVDVIKYKKLTDEEKAQGIRGSVTDHILKPSESQDYTKNASYRRTIGAVLKENERNSRGMTLNIYDEEVPLNPPKAKRNLGKMALWSVATTVASYAPAKNRISAVTSKKVHGADVLVPGKPGASASEASLMYGQGIGYGEIIDAFRTKKKAVKTSQPASIPKTQQNRRKGWKRR